MTDANDQFTQSDFDVWRESLMDLMQQATVAKLPPQDVLAELQHMAVYAQQLINDLLLNHDHKTKQE